MDMLGVFILSTAIGIGASRGPASEQEDAYKALMKATYLETDMDQKAKQFEKRYLPKELKEYGGWITGVAKIAKDRKISFEWTF